MFAYASNTGTKRNLEALRGAGWRIIITPYDSKPPEGFRFGIDNWAWTCHQKGLPFNESEFMSLVEKYGCAADFVVLPDIVAGGNRSLQLSVSYLPKLRHLRSLLLPLQDGMDPEGVGEVLRENPQVGLFLGGSTEYKLREMYGWGMVAHSWKRWYHVGRVNTARRIRLCAEAGATSFDGTSASRFSCTVPLLQRARSQASLLTPEAMSC